MRRRHDPFLKLLYRAGARDAVTLFFPDLAARIDWERLQWIDKEVPIRGERPRAVVADLVGLTRDVEGRYLKVLFTPRSRCCPTPRWAGECYNTTQRCCCGKRSPARAC